MTLFAGIDIGGTNLRVGVVDGLKIIHQNRIHADFSDICKNNPPDTAWPKILGMINEALSETLQQFPQITSIGIGFPGFIDPENGRIAQSPNLPGLMNVDLAGDLSQAISKPVIVENDALAAAYGEFRLNGTKNKNLIYIGLGTGVGGGLILAEKPFSGQHGVAMEVGHIIVVPDGRPCGCGNHGCLEQYASATGVKISYSESKTDKQQFGASHIAELASAGDKHALEAYRIAGDKLGQALAHIFKTLDVADVVIGGGMSKAWPLMQQAFNQRLQTDLIPVLRDKISIKLSISDDSAGIIGAALLAGEKG